MLTIPTDAPWVPLRILSLGLDGSELVEADVFLLTDDEPDLLAGGPGLTLERSEEASSSLLDDLRSDAGMEWVPEEMWFTYLAVDVEARDLDYDLAVSADEATLPTLADTGVSAPDVRPISTSGGGVVSTIGTPVSRSTSRGASPRSSTPRSSTCSSVSSNWPTQVNATDLRSLRYP